MLFYSASKFWESGYKRDKIVAFCFYISVVLNVAMWVLLFWMIKPLSYLNEFGLVALHYNVYFGIDKVGSWFYVLVMPITGLIILIANTLIGYLLYLKDSLISYTLSVSQLITHVVLIVATVLLILLNT